MRLDRVTREEARISVAQTLGVVHGLVGNVRIVMEGVQCLHDWLLIFYWTLVPLDGKVSTDGIRRDLGKCLAEWVSIRLLTRGRSRSSRNTKRTEQDETFVVYSLTFPCQNGLYVSGVQLQRDVQRWLSPPDPSTNYHFVWSSHHEGTSAWFLESDVFKKWKETGSLLWIHGKRMSL
jgi:hypothetical protein